jgi:hypothetical protein
MVSLAFSGLQNLPVGNHVRTGFQQGGSVRTPEPADWNLFEWEFNRSVLPGRPKGLVTLPFKWAATELFSLARGCAASFCQCK